MSARTLLAGVCLTVLFAAVPALAGGVAIVNAARIDDGDGDGYADTRETVSLQLTVQNRTGGPLTGVTATLHTEAAALACLSIPSVAVGSLAAGEIKVLDPFVFSVANVDRTGLGLGPYDDLSVAFDVAFDSDGGPVPGYPSVLDFDLDLDVSGGASPTSFLETFEGTLGAFEIHNMDQGLDDLEAADGWRCQTHDPDWENSNSSGFPEVAATCYLGITPEHSDAVFWGLSGPAFSPLGGRAFTGFHSLFFGIDLGPTENWTTPLSVLEAVRTTDPIALDWAGPGPTLSFKHQISVVDDYQGYNGGFDRGVVMVQLADDAGAPVGSWIKVHAYQNPYAGAIVTNAADCMFDPIDDGNSEDDFFDPTDPNRRTGPSSTCEPGLAFMEMGETSNPFNAASLGSADGPGLEGQWGIGTWVESRFDLSRFRGRQVRMRFLVSAIRIGEFATWNDFGGQCCQNPSPEDDGWWIDDVTIDHALMTPATVAVDAKDNSGLPGSPGPDGDGDGIHDICDICPSVASTNSHDRDGDGAGDACDSCPYDPLSTDGTDFDGDLFCVDNCPYVYNAFQNDTDGDTAGDGCDCAFLDPTVYPGAVEINDAKDNQCPGDHGFGVVDELSGTITFCDPADKNKLCWPAQQGATRYQVARASKADYTQGCTALPQTGQLFLTDAAAVPAGQVRFYLVRPRLPNPGSWGQRSDGTVRTVLCAL